MSITTTGTRATRAGASDAVSRLVTRRVASATPAMRGLGGAVRPRSGALYVKAVGSFVPRLTKKAFEKYGFSAATLLTDWARIVGPELASYTAPERLKWPRRPDSHAATEDGAEGRPGAMLLLKVDAGRALDVEYRRRQIAERINGYFGYRAVAEIKILQAPLGVGRPKTSLARHPSGSPVPAAAATPLVDAVCDPGLREALARMQARMGAARNRAAARGV